MRYFKQPTITYTDKDGISYEIKEGRKLESLSTMLELKIGEGDAIDEIATRKNIYGDNAELLAYKIFDHNAVAITDAGFDLSRIKSLRIPLT